LTSDCAPKAMAIPATPAVARKGMMEMPSEFRIASVASATMMEVASLPSTLLTVAARRFDSMSCACRAVNFSRPLISRRAMNTRTKVMTRMTVTRAPACIQSTFSNHCISLMSSFIRRSALQGARN
jgi:hypothetical protein